MKRRMFVMLLATAALAACNGDFLPVDRTVTGDWTTPQTTVAAPFPFGSRNVLAFTEFHLLADRSYLRVRYLVDLSNQTTVIDAIDQGTYTAQGGTLWAKVDHAYYRGGSAPLENPIPQSVDRTDEFRYVLEGDQLLLTPQCPANANCIEPVVVRLSRMQPID